VEVRNNNKKPRVEPSQASIPRGQYFAFRLIDAADFEGYTIHWVFNGRRIPGAHKAELGFYHMRPRFDGEYKVLLVKDQEIIASNTVKLETLASEAQAKVVNEEPKPAQEELFFDPLAPEPIAPVAPVAEVPAENKKRAFLQKALSKAKKAA
jgi:hypothetical protein